MGAGGPRLLFQPKNGSWTRRPVLCSSAPGKARRRSRLMPVRMSNAAWRG